MEDERPVAPPEEHPSSEDTIVPQPAADSQAPGQQQQHVEHAQQPQPAPAQPQSAQPAQGGEDLSRRWEAVLAGFVDNPRQAVQQADRLLEEVIQGLGQEKAQLQRQWSGSENASTEDLRVVLQRYRDMLQSLSRRRQ